MRPSLIDSMSWAMAEVYGAVTDRILVNLARHFPYIKDAGEVRGAFEYQARMLGQMGQINRETADIIMQSLDGADQALRGALETAILDALKTEEPKLRKAAEKGMLRGGGLLPPEMSANQMQAFQAYYRQSADKLNLVNTVMLESTQAAYTATVTDAAARIGRTQSILNVGAGEVVTGVSGWNQAMHDAVKKMVENGLTGFIDHGGHKWSPEAYVAMDIRTTMFNTARAAVWERAGQYGADLYQVSSHNGARPLCYPWQGKIISRSDWTGEVEDIDGNKIHVYAQSETSYGQAAGLFGVNCKHYPMTFIPGFSAQRGEPQDPEENAEAYALSQQQRGLERKLREEKRDLAVMKAQGASEDQIRAQKERVNRASAQIDDFCDEHGLPRRRNREGAPVRATWPDENGGRVERFQGGYVPTDQPLPEPITERVIVPEPEPVQPVFTPAKTRAEAEEYARQHFADTIDYTGINIENANKINETLTTLTEKYPIDRLDYISQKSIGSVARANHDHLEINGKKLGKVLKDDELNFKLGQTFAKNEAQLMRQRYADKAKIPFGIQQKIDKLENGLKFSRYGVHSTYDDHVRTVITHEYGHILSDQYFGMINKERGNPNYATNWSLRGMNDKWKAAYNKAFETGDIYGLSEYGSKNEREFFAESFAAREMGETIPDYIEALFREVFADGIM